MILLFGMFSARALAQQTVSAAAVMNDLRNGKSISYDNVIITGDLDFTFMKEKMPELPDTKKWWKDGGSNTVDELIEVSISFINCTFEDDVLAYIHHERSGYTFTADFDQSVIFKGCEFRRKAMFKYSNFDRTVSFEDSKFQGETTFKYAKFDEMANFTRTYFEDDATFKYAQFEQGGSFMKAVFEESWNIKYMEAEGDFEISGLKVKDDIDDKYTKINGRSFSSYLISSSN